jgi:hypothetical protein
MRVHPLLCGLLLGGCASVPPPAPVDPGSAAEERPLLSSYLEQQQSLFDALEHPSDGPPDCPQQAALASRICELSERTCTLAARSSDDDAFKTACPEAADRCQRARLRADACQKSTRE